MGETPNLQSGEVEMLSSILGRRFYGGLVKRLRHRPFTAVVLVRVQYPLLNRTTRQTNASERHIMNRQERRKNKITAKPKTYILTDAQIAQLKADAVREATNKAFIAMLGLPLVALRKFDFGKKRLEKFLEELLFQYKCFEGDHITLDELKQIIFNETGMRIEEKT